MKNNRTAKKIAVAGASAVLALFSLAPAFAATTTDYGVWSEPAPADGGYNGTISFAGTTIPAATYSTVFSVADDSNLAEVKDSTEEWIPEGTPFGDLFGSSGPSETNNFLKLGVASSDEPYIFSTTYINFESAVPADSLGIVIGDLDIDSVKVSAIAEDDTDLTGEQLIGSADPVGFNLCNTEVNVPTICGDVTDKTDVPVTTINANDVTFVNSEVGEDVGVSAWLKPSVSLKSLTIVHTGVGATSTVRVWLAGPKVETGEELANTGSNNSNLALFAATFTLLGALTIAFARRLRED